MFDTILDMVNKFIPDSDAANKLSLKLEQEYTKQMSMKSEIIQAETRNGSGQWRVRLMYLCMFLVSLHVLLYQVIPYIVVIGDFDVYTPEAPESTEQLWSFLKIGVGGYIGSRGAEKIVGQWRSK